MVCLQYWSPVAFELQWQWGSGYTCEPVVGNGTYMVRGTSDTFMGMVDDSVFHWV